MVRRDSPLFDKFGEIYFSFTKYQVVKAWKVHTKFSQLISVPIGELKLVLYDARNASPSFGRLAEAKLCQENYCLVKIPPGVIYGFQSLTETGTLIASFLDEPHDPKESGLISPDSNEVPYQW